MNVCGIWYFCATAEIVYCPANSDPRSLKNVSDTVDSRYNKHACSTVLVLLAGPVHVTQTW